MILNFEATEKKVLDKEGSYYGLSEQALLTSEEDFRRIFLAIGKVDTFVDFGSGYGTGPILFSELNPMSHAIGIEFDQSRVSASQKRASALGQTQVQFRCEDLLTCPLPTADLYFFYFPTGPVLDRLLTELGSFTHQFKIVVIESHGDFLDRLKLEGWLTEIQQIPLSSPRHYPYAVVYEKTDQKKPSVFDYSYQDYALIVSSDQGDWIGESRNLEFLNHQQVNLKVPPRSIDFKDITLISPLSDLGGDVLSLFRWRRLGDLCLTTEGDQFNAQIRKIFVRPSFELELSSGQKVEWESIKSIKWENQLCYDQSSHYYFFPVAP